jgi:hypothetical protein
LGDIRHWRGVAIIGPDHSKFTFPADSRRTLVDALRAGYETVLEFLAGQTDRAAPTQASTGVSTFLLAVPVLSVGPLRQITIHPAMAWHYAREGTQRGAEGSDSRNRTTFAMVRSLVRMHGGQPR